ncbi:UDP-N-acetylglucosamine 2-epimerase (hydrolyzing) [Patescibacteria group bacterium]|nr:UDP-N-acetylglucosamine 2-epimerase (hydrolyzing) [Patescibacteria group bacterium]
MRKICIVTANRSEYSRIKTIIDAIIEHPALDLSVVATGSHLLEKYGNTIKDVKEDGVRIDHQIYMELDGNNLCTMAKSISVAISDLSTYFDNQKIDAVIVMGDRYEALSVAVAASVMNIPIAHVQGGEITGTIDESIRHAITKLAHIHFPANEKSRERIIRMGERPERVFSVGCPGTDLLLNAPQYAREDVIMRINNKYVKDIESKIDTFKPFILCIQHPVTTEFGKNFDQIQETISALKKINNFQLIVLWPNIDAGAGDMALAIRRFQHDCKNNVFFMKHASHDIFVNLLRHAKCLIGNSSSGIREACYFGTPTVNIGTRQQYRDRGKNVMNVPYDRDAIYQAIEHQVGREKYEPEFLYGNGSAGEKIANILAEIDLSQIQKRNTY